MQIALRYAARSNVGLGPKSRNEDSAYAGQHLLVLADGMGGHAAGDVASSMVVGYLAPLDEEAVSGEQALATLQQTLREANTGLGDAMDDNPALDGMGTTTIVMLRAGGKLAMAHIGDSRAYLQRGGELTQITKDHSFVQQLLDAGRITPDEAGSHPQRSLVTKVMTGSPDDEPDLSIRELTLGDRYLLCSDGLSDYVSFDIIREVVAEASTAEVCADRLVEVALKAHTRDNVTVVVADVVDLDDPVGPPPSTPQIVGAAGARSRRTKTRAIPVSPAEKAALLAREATGRDDDGSDDTDELTLAEESPSRRARWVTRSVIAALAVVTLVGGGYAGYAWSQRQLFIGESSGYVATYHGVAATLGPLDLSTLEAASDVALADLPVYYQQRVKDTFAVTDSTEAARRITELRELAQLCRVRPDLTAPCTYGEPGSLPTSSPSALPTGTSTVLPSGLPSASATPNGTSSGAKPTGTATSTARPTPRPTARPTTGSTPPNPNAGVAR